MALLTTLVALLLAACSGESATGDDNADTGEPITVVMDDMF